MCGYPFPGLGTFKCGVPCPGCCACLGGSGCLISGINPGFCGVIGCAGVVAFSFGSLSFWPSKPGKPFRVVKADLDNISNTLPSKGFFTSCSSAAASMDCPSGIERRTVCAIETTSRKYSPGARPVFAASLRILRSKSLVKRNRGFLAAIRLFERTASFLFRIHPSQPKTGAIMVATRPAAGAEPLSAPQGKCSPYTQCGI